MNPARTGATRDELARPNGLSVLPPKRAFAAWKAWEQLCVGYAWGTMINHF